jgi:hypothetical protein
MGVSNKKTTLLRYRWLTRLSKSGKRRSSAKNIGKRSARAIFGFDEENMARRSRKKAIVQQNHLGIRSYELQKYRMI